MPSHAKHRYKSLEADYLRSSFPFTSPPMGFRAKRRGSRSLDNVDVQYKANSQYTTNLRTTRRNKKKMIV